MAGPKWNREVVGYKIGTGSRARAAGLRYVGDRPMGASRALPWIAPALPSAAGLLNTRVGAAHALGTMARIASVIANASPDRITASAGVRSGLVDQAGTAEPERAPIYSSGVGSVPYLKPGEQVARIQTGPDETARKYESQLEKDVSSALNMPLERTAIRLQLGQLQQFANGMGRTPWRRKHGAADGGTATTAFRSISKSFPTPSRLDACRA